MYVAHYVTKSLFILPQNQPGKDPRRHLTNAWTAISNGKSLHPSLEPYKPPIFCTSANRCTKVCHDKAMLYRLSRHQKLCLPKLHGLRCAGPCASSLHKLQFFYVWFLCIGAVQHKTFISFHY